MTAELILTALIKVNLWASIAIVLVLLLRRVGRRLLGVRTAYGLWLIVPLIALAAFVPAKYVEPANPALDSAPAIPITWIDEAGIGWDAVVERAFAPDFASVLVAMWLAGAVLLFGRTLVTSLRLAADPGTGPALVGVFRPKLVLPLDFEARFDEGERRLVLAHEDTHRAARHPLINGLIEAGRCVNWFNPLMHLAAGQHRLDQELACDAEVIERHPNERRAYAEALLKTQFALSVVPLGCQWPPRSAPMLKERLHMLAAKKPSHALRLAGVLIAGAATGLGVVAAWSAQPPRVREYHASMTEQSASALTPSPSPGLVQKAPATPRRGAPPSADAPLKAGEILSITVNMTGEDLTMPVPIDAEGVMRGPGGQRLVVAGRTVAEVERLILADPSAPPGVKVRVARQTGPVSLTNAGAPRPLVIAPANVREAIAAGNGYAAMKLGGTPSDALAAINNKVRSEPRFLAEDPTIVQDMERLADTSDGSTLIAAGERQDGALMIRRSDASGVPKNMIFLRPDGMFGVAVSIPPPARPTP